MATHSSILAWRVPGMGAWWATIYGVTQSRTRLTWLSSSSSNSCLCILVYLSLFLSLFFLTHTHWKEWQTLNTGQKTGKILYYPTCGWLKNPWGPTSLVVEWLGHCLSMQGLWIPSPVKELRSYMHHRQTNKQNIKQGQYCKKKSMKTLKMVHIPKK